MTALKDEFLHLSAEVVQHKGSAVHASPTNRPEP